MKRTDELTDWLVVKQYNIERIKAPERERERDSWIIGKQRRSLAAVPSVCNVLYSGEIKQPEIITQRERSKLIVLHIETRQQLGSWVRISIIHCTVFDCTVYSVLCTVYCVLCTVYCVLCTVYCVLCTVYCTVYCTAYCTVYSVLCTVYCVLCTVYCVLCTVLTD